MNKMYKFSLSLMFLLIAGNFAFAFDNPQSEVTRNSAEKIGVSFSEQLNSGNFSALIESFDFANFAVRTAKTIDDEQKYVREFKKGFLQSVKGNEQNFFLSLKPDAQASAKYIRVIKKNQPLIRIDYTGGATSYFTLILESKNDNKPMIVDLFTFVNNSYYSQQLGSTSSLMTAPSKSLLKRMFGLEKINENLVEKMKEIGGYRRSGESQKILDVVNQLPEKIQNTEIFLILKIEATSIEEEKKYEAAVNKYIEVVGESKAANLMLIDYFFLKEDFKKVIRTVDNLEKQIGGSDGVTQMFKANAYFSDKNYKQALKSSKQSVLLEPDSEQAYWTMFNAYIYLAEHKNAVGVINDLEEKFFYEFVPEDFKEEVDWKEFVNSSEFIEHFK